MLVRFEGLLAIRRARRIALAVALGSGLLAPAPAEAVKPLCPRSLSVMIDKATHVVAARPLALKTMRKGGWRYERASYALVRAFVGKRRGRTLLVERYWKEGPAPSGPGAPIRVVPAALPGFDEAGKPRAETTPLLLFLDAAAKSDFDRARVSRQVQPRGTCHPDGPAHEVPLKGAKRHALPAVHKQLTAKKLVRPRI